MVLIGTGVAPRTVHIDNQAIETVSRFTYLGSVTFGRLAGRDYWPSYGIDSAYASVIT